MKSQKMLCALVGVFLLHAGLVGLAAGQEIEYFREGKTGAFHAEVKVPPGMEIATTVFNAVPESEKVYEVYIRTNQTLGERLSAIDNGRPALTLEQQKEVERIDKELQPLNKERSEIRSPLYSQRNSMRSMERERDRLKKEGGHEEEIAQLEKVIVRYKAEIAEADLKILELSNKISARYSDRNAIYAEARKNRIENRETGFKELTMSVYGRFNGKGRAKVEVYGRESKSLLSDPQLLTVLDLRLPKEDGGAKEVLQQWSIARAHAYGPRIIASPYSSYYQYSVLAAKQKYGIQEESILRWIPQQETVRRGRREVDLYAMSTGALAIQESLQLEEMTGRRDVAYERDTDIGVLEGPQVRSHPFEEMLEGRNTRFFSIASLVPFDNYYCHFSSIAKEIEASDLLKQWGTSLLRGMTVSARDSDLPSRYMEQICIDVSQLTRLFGGLVIDDLAITGSDPFLREGSDVAAIISVRQQKVFDTLMSAYVTSVLAANPDAELSQRVYNAIPISVIATPDRRISSYSAYVGQYKVHATTEALIKRIIDTKLKRVASMANNLDFQYMRTIFPGTKQHEDGFLYFSDAHIRKLLSPKWKIGEQRRVICQSHMKMIGNAALMYRVDNGLDDTVVPTMAQLIEGKFIDPKLAICPDSGTYRIDKSGRVFCSKHNCLRYCTPVAEIEIDKVSKGEVADYKAFVERYNSYWSRFFDPIGIRLRVGDRVEIETCILPLIENTIYNQLRDFVGGAPVELGSSVMTTGTIGSLTAKLLPDNQMFMEMEKMRKQAFPTLPALGQWLGSNFSIHLYDNDVLFTFAEEGMNMFGGWMDLEEQLIFGMVASSINLPMYAVVELRDEDKAKDFIREGLSLLQWSSDVENRGRTEEVGFETYTAAPHNEHEINTLVMRLFILKFRLHYAITPDRLIVSTKRHVLEHVLDTIDAEGVAEKVTPVGNIMARVQPSAFNQLRPSVRQGWQERMRDACQKNLESVRVLYEHYGATSETLNHISKQIEGVSVRCPNGGEYHYDRLRGIVYCSVHGNKNHPGQPLHLSENEGVLDFINRMQDFGVRFQFTEEGIMTKIEFDLAPEGAVVE